MAQEFPKLEIGQYAVIHCEGDTGIVILPDGRRHIRDDSPVDPLSEKKVEKWAARGDMWLVFNSLAEAKKYSSDKLNEMPGIQCGIYDHQQNQVELLWNQEYVDAFLAKARAERQKKWYKKILDRWF